jgi:hypothetical protein
VTGKSAAKGEPAVCVFGDATPGPIKANGDLDVALVAGFDGAFRAKPTEAGSGREIVSTIGDNPTPTPKPAPNPVIAMLNRLAELIAVQLLLATETEATSPTAILADFPDSSTQELLRGRYFPVSARKA